MTAHHPTVRAVWTDFGGVLTPPVNRHLADFCEREGIPVDAFRRAMAEVARPFGGDLMAPLDTPLLSQDEWSDRITAAIRADTGLDVDLSGFDERWFAGRRPNQPWLDRLRELRAEGYFIGLLSNMPPAWDRHWRRMVPPEGLFDSVVLSFEVGARKPEPALFELAATRAGLHPSECLLVDDLAANCAGARAAGWQAVEFGTADAAIAELAGLLADRPAAVGR